LNKLGVLYYHFPSVDGVDALAAERGYKNRDEIKVSPQHMGEVYEDKVKMFFHEHLHEDEEIRYVRDGLGYFDVRSQGDEWVRVQLGKDDLLILPAGIYHRFTTDESNVSAQPNGGRPAQSMFAAVLIHKTQFVHAMRLFKDEPKWTPLNRDPALDANQYRQAYVQGFLS
jgi:1,2-dihydroxy-3-keto-5-methylthiopentene dioxygenase